MKLNELLTDFATLSFVDVVGNVNLEKDHIGDADKSIFPGLELFEVPFIEIQGEVAIKRTEWVYVTDRGTAGEVAKWKGNFPSASTRANQIAQKYNSLVEQYHGKVIDQGANFIVVQSWHKNATSELMESKKHLIEEDGTITEIAE